MKTTFKFAVQLLNRPDNGLEIHFVGKDVQISDVALSEFHHKTLPNGDVVSDLEDGTLLYTNDVAVVTSLQLLHDLCNGTAARL